MATSIILGSLTDTSQQFRFTRADSPSMRASSEPGQPWRWVWLLDDWWRAYNLAFKDSPAAGTLVLWIVAGDAFTPRDRAALQQEGWTPVAPVVVRNGPVRCEAVVINPHQAAVLVSKETVWAPGALVPMQRTWACFETSLNVRVRCGDFATTANHADAATALLVVAHDEDIVTQSRSYTSNRGSVTWEQQNRVRQCDAITVDVSYFLGAPMVVGVDIHRPELLQPDDLRGSLPPDVTEELVEALRMLGIHRIAAGEDVWEDEGAD